ncbi:LysM peptidoglycan-binding domain-containing protein [uncultured Agrobacterium sp.]|uniref:LysM peptidoglycan-binding domain-containing protein n=1 Tax=uncultured Agrobacterium sp. TaxID=157277 RepID=UPI0025FD3BD6|nr:LysM peptidoglycan-binding domain-containing protein [uncultured Agrobacterium sp.]
MKNKRAALLALVVLGIATLLMVFFVLPRMSGDDKPIGDAINEASNAVKNSVEMGSEKAGDLLSDAAGETTNVADKVGRLAESATKSIKDMSNLFSDNKVPSNEDFAAARKKVEESLRELDTIDIPESLDETTSRLITTARSAAERTLAYLRGLPDDASAAAAQVRRLAGVFAGTDDGAPRQEPPAAPAPAAPAPAQEPAQPAARTESAPANDAAAQLPSFDVLRVEPDGSAVIAGKAQPGSQLEIVNKGQVIAKTPVESSGDFAAVLDNPLPPGDHELVLRATGKNGKVSQSQEVATVSVPAQKGGDLLAMVTTPGKASRVLTMPETAPAELQPQATGNAQAPATNARVGTVPETASVRVTAVEFDGSKIYIAGSAPAGTPIRALVDETRVGDTKTEASGSFVIEGDIQLTVGNHVITAEALDESGKVTVRVRVPFSRPEADQGTVAMQPSGAVTASQSAPTSSDRPAAVSDQAAFEALRTEVAKAFGILSGLYKDGKTPTLDEVAAAKSATAIALRSLSEFRTAASADPAFTNFVAEIAREARSLLSLVDALPNDVAAVGKAIAGLTDRFAALNAKGPATPAPANTGEPATDSSGTKTFEQAPLAHSDSTVIIRRGDTLWQISRRVYGQGVRYTTIYLANQQQIQNPDLIEPGQIFDVPEKALPNAEEIHRNRLKTR